MNQLKRLAKTRPQAWITGGAIWVLWSAYKGSIGRWPAWLAGVSAVGGAIAVAGGVLALVLRSKLKM